MYICIYMYHILSLLSFIQFKTSATGHSHILLTTQVHSMYMYVHVMHCIPAGNSEWDMGSDTVVDVYFSITDTVHCESKHFIQKCRAEWEENTRETQVREEPS